MATANRVRPGKPEYYAPVPYVGSPPATIVGQPGPMTLEDLEQRIRETRAAHDETLQKFHQVWYDCGHTWVVTHFLGVGVMKSTTDLWTYHDLMTVHRPKTVIETGTYKGGSALWFAFLMEALQVDGHVWTIDREDYRVCGHPRITFIGGDSRDPALVAALAAEIQYPLLISLDSDHSAQHVYDELVLYAPLCQVGDWLVVEDTNIAWVGEGGDEGARGGIIRYLTEHPGEWRQDVASEKYLLSMHPGGWLQRMAPCSHP